MQEDQFNYLRLLRPLSFINDKIYDERDFMEFRPSYEYLISRESRSCQHCRSLIYTQTSDVGNLSVIDILSTRYFPKEKKDKSTFEVIIDVSEKINSLFGVRPIDEALSKSYKKAFENSCNNLKTQLKVTERVLYMPIFHRCNKCFKAWNVHLEMKRRFLPPSLFEILNTSKISVAEFNLPKVEKYFQGILFLTEKSEEKQIINHIIDVKKMFIEDDGGLLISAKKYIVAGDLSSAINNLCVFTNQLENKFYYNPSLQLQSRYSMFLQEKLRGTLSRQEETLQYNRISNDTITLIDEINKYKNM